MALAAERAEQARLAAQLAADVDTMTSLYSRRAWDELLAEAHARFEHLGDPTAVVVIDLDGLMATNDTLGHAAGVAAAEPGGGLAAAVRAADAAMYAEKSGRDR